MGANRSKPSNHELHVVLEDGPLDTEEIFDDFTELGGDEVRDVSLEEYLGDWEGLNPKNLYIP